MVSNKQFQVTTCTTERVSTHQYDDAAPTTQFLELNYTSGGAPCIDEEIMPLTTDKSALHSLANSLSAGGSTSRPSRPRLGLVHGGAEFWLSLANRQPTEGLWLSRT